MDWVNIRIEEMEQMAKNCLGVTYHDDENKWYDLEWCYGSYSERFESYQNKELEKILEG